MTDSKQVIQDFADLMVKNQLNELEYETADFYVRLVGSNGTVKTQTPAVQPQVSSSAVVEKKYILSPMVGVVYLAKNTDTAPFVSVGDNVGADTTVCLIEAMKTFNTVKAEQNGKIAAVLVADGAAVEYGQPLFEVV